MTWTPDERRRPVPAKPHAPRRPQPRHSSDHRRPSVGLDGDAGRRTVLFVALEPRTLPPVGTYFRKLLDDTAPKLTPLGANPPPEPAKNK